MVQSLVGYATHVSTAHANRLSTISLDGVNLCFAMIPDPTGRDAGNIAASVACNKIDTQLPHTLHMQPWLCVHVESATTVYKEEHNTRRNVKGHGDVRTKAVAHLVVVKE